MANLPTPQRGEVWLVDFNPSVGAEIRKARPAVVVSVDGIGKLPLRIVVPLTDWKPHYADFSWFIRLPADPTNGLTKDSSADTFQIKSVSESRFVRRLGEVSLGQLDDISSAVAMCVGAA